MPRFDRRDAPSPFKPAVLTNRNAALMKRQTLQGLAIAYIIGELPSTAWWKKAKEAGFNPFQYLPNPILLSVLDEFCNSRCDSDEYLSQVDWDLLDLFLQAASVTEIDLRKWRHPENFETVIKKLIVKCPELKILTLKHLKKHHPNLMLLEDQICPGNYAPQKIHPYFNWLKNLCVLRALALFDRESLQMAANFLLNLEVFEFSVQEENFKDVTILTALPSLKEIYINLLYLNPPKHTEPQDVVDTLMRLVESLPGLTTLGSSELIRRPETSHNFIAQFGSTVCSSRVLLIDSMCLEDTSVEIFNADWVENLKVRRLCLDGIREKTAEELCRLVPTDQLRALEIYSNRPNIIYKLLGSLTANVTHLLLADTMKVDGLNESDYELDVHKVLLAVPQIKDFVYSQDLLFQTNKPEEQVDADFFKGVKRFGGLSAHLDYHRKEVSRILKKFILGSEVCKELKISSTQIHIDFITKLLHKHPHLELRIRKLFIDLDNSDEMYAALEVATSFVTRSPMLDEIEIFLSEDYDEEYDLQSLEAYLNSGGLGRFKDKLASLGIKLVFRHIIRSHPNFENAVRSLWWSDYCTEF